MKRLLICSILSALSILCQAQSIKTITPLSSLVDETSGLIYLNGKLITHNDSGGEPILYEIDAKTGKVVRKVLIQNAKNIDWEDLTYDENYIYIADTGNNRGARKNLKIYRVLISAFMNERLDSIKAETISIKYADQISFKKTNRKTNFDAEAIISINDSLYIFSKNWSNGWTNVYAFPKKAGSYSLSRIDSLNAMGLVTGATYNQKTNTIMLSGYGVSSNFLLEISSFEGNEFSKGKVIRIEISPEGSKQVEGITQISPTSYYLSAEKSNTPNAILYIFEK